MGKQEFYFETKFVLSDGPTSHETEQSIGTHAKPIYSNLFQPSDNLRTVSLAKDKHSNRGMESWPPTLRFRFLPPPPPLLRRRTRRRGGWKPRRPSQSRSLPNSFSRRQPRQSHLISTKSGYSNIEEALDDSPRLARIEDAF